MHLGFPRASPNSKLTSRRASARCRSCNSGPGSWCFNEAMRCVVPGCQSGYAEGKEKFPLFKPPANQELFDKWKANIPRRERPLSRKDKVCALHFEQHLVFDKYYGEHKGNTLLNEHKRARLRKGAVPTIFEFNTSQPADSGSNSLPPRQSGRTAAEQVLVVPATPVECTNPHVEPCPCTEFDACDVRPGCLKKLQHEDSGSSVESQSEISTTGYGVVHVADAPEGSSNTSASLLDELLQRPESVKLPLSWNYHKVYTYQGIRVIYSSMAVANDLTTPIVTKHIIVCESSQDAPFQAFILNHSLKDVVDLAEQPSTLEDVARLVELVDNIPMCRGGPAAERYRDAGTRCAYVDCLGAWRHNKCELYGSQQCLYCASLGGALRTHTAGQCKRKRIEQVWIPLSPTKKVEAASAAKKPTVLG